ncbi:hypothetical protein CYMTET_44527 [Cymbomonas tetramitiformis]|uniref:Uncharacterized protein n=1 Tax=Cymbomonas tetramitiformis TaxID=36881 RepID=A0AAE0C007_9CHLO|nr:hypothetical protein CYMTET_44527 [Cymbomonas tetramitiformis]
MFLSQKLTWVDGCVLAGWFSGWLEGAVCNEPKVETSWRDHEHHVLRRLRGVVTWEQSRQQWSRQQQAADQNLKLFNTVFKKRFVSCCYMCAL